MKRPCVVLLSSLAILSVTPKSFAQVVETAPPPSAPPAGAPGTTTVVETGPPVRPTTEVVEKKEDEDYAHFRFGLGLDGNYLFTPGTNGIQGLGVGIQVRLGAQMNQWFALYYQAHGIVGGTLSDSGNLTGAGVIGTVFNSGVLEATLPVLHLGVGPSADVLGVAGLTSHATEVLFGLEGRAAIVIGGHGPGHHAGFALNFNVHPTFWNGTAITTLSAGIGGEMY